MAVGIASGPHLPIEHGRSMFIDRSTEEPAAQAGEQRSRQVRRILGLDEPGSPLKAYWHGALRDAVVGFADPPQYPATLFDFAGPVPLIGIPSLDLPVGYYGYRAHGSGGLEMTTDNAFVSSRSPIAQFLAYNTVGQALKFGFRHWEEARAFYDGHIPAGEGYVAYISTPAAHHVGSAVFTALSLPNRGLQGVDRDGAASTFWTPGLVTPEDLLSAAAQQFGPEIELARQNSPAGYLAIAGAAAVELPR